MTLDDLDAVAADCEHVNAVDVGNANEDKPPTVAFVAPAQDSAKAGKKTISSWRAKVRKNCTFKRRVAFNDPGRLPKKGVLKFTVRFQGNAVLTAKKSKARRVRTK